MSELTQIGGTDAYRSEPIEREQLIVRVDLNWIRGGLLQAFKDDCNREPQVGEVAIVLDEDGTVREATIVSTSDDRVQLDILPLTMMAPQQLTMEDD